VAVDSHKGHVCDKDLFLLAQPVVHLAYVIASLRIDPSLYHVYCTEGNADKESDSGRLRSEAQASPKLEAKCINPH
jgi:hypothetical protein